MTSSRVVVVGGGIIGLAVARELTRRRPGAVVTVLEKEGHLASHQTGHNSGVVHAGIYYRPGSLKAELCTRGRLLLKDFCAERDIPYVECGKVVVAVDTSEMGRLDALERSATDNGVPGLRRLDAAGIREVEPHAAGVAALHSPATAITDFVAVAEAYAADIRSAGGEIRLGATVDRIERRGTRVVVGSTREPVTADEVVVCAGLQADRVSALADGLDGPRIVPFRGEYLAVLPPKRDLVRGLVYPVPDPRYPFLGVHFTRRVGGEVDVGPNAVLALAREGYRWREVSLRDLAGVAAWPGAWRMARRHWRTGVDEVRGSVSMAAYMALAQRYVPEIGAGDVTGGGAGVRAQAVDRDGSLVDDFRIHVEDGITTVRNAPSPAATSSLAIAGHIVDRMGA